eukprot:129835-Chlamydomonas_euryale.AAC.1
MIVNFGSPFYVNLCQEAMFDMEYTYTTILTTIYQPMRCATAAQLQFVVQIDFRDARFSELMVYVFQSANVDVLARRWNVPCNTQIVFTNGPNTTSFHAGNVNALACPPPSPPQPPVPDGT